MNEAPKSAKKKLQQQQQQNMSPDDSTALHSANPNTPFALRQLSPDFVIERVPPTEPRHTANR
jgi:hypothetical protein